MNRRSGRSCRYLSKESSRFCLGAELQKTSSAFSRWRGAAVACGRASCPAVSCYQPSASQTDRIRSKERERLPQEPRPFSSGAHFSHTTPVLVPVVSPRWPEPRPVPSTSRTSLRPSRLACLLKNSSVFELNSARLFEAVGEVNGGCAGLEIAGHQGLKEESLGPTAGAWDCYNPVELAVVFRAKIQIFTNSCPRYIL